MNTSGKTVSVGKRERNKLDHIKSIVIESPSTNGDSQEALVIWFADCMERDGFDPAGESVAS